MYINGDNPASGGIAVEQDDSVIVAVADTLDFIEPDATIVTESPTGEANITLSGYALLAGRPGGQTLTGGTGSGDDLIFESTSHATKGIFIFGATTEDNRVVINGTEADITINGVALASRLLIHDESSAQVEVLGLHKHTSTAASASNLIFARSRGSEASESVVVDGDGLGRLRWAGFDGTDYAQAAQISVEVDGTPGSNDMPGRMLFLTTPDGSQTPTEAMRINSSQWVGIGGGTDPFAPLHIINSGNPGIAYPVGADPIFIVQNSGSAGADSYIYVISDDTGLAGITFGNEAVVASAVFGWDEANGLMTFDATGQTLFTTPGWSYTGDGDFDIGPDTTNAININAQGADVNTVIQGSTDTALVHIDAGLEKVGFSTSTPDHLLDVDGSFGGRVVSITGNTTLDDTHFIVYASAQGGSFTITLPAASGCPGRIYMIIRTDASVNTITLARTGSDTINGGTSLGLGASTSYIMTNNGGILWNTASRV